MRWGGIIFAVIIVLVSILSVIMGIFGDLFWFSSLGIESVYLTMLLTSVGLGFVFFALFLIFALVNVRIAKRSCADKKKKTRAMDVPVIALSFVLAIVTGALFSRWDTVLKYINRSAFSVTDPVFGLDMGFYVFELPFYNMMVQFVFVTLILSAVITFVSYVIYSHSIRKEEPPEVVNVMSPQMPNYVVDWKKVLGKFMTHLKVLLGLVFFTLSFALLLGRFGILFSSAGAVFGAGYTDVNVMLPLVTLLSVVSFIIGILFIAFARKKKAGTIAKLIGAFVAIAILGSLAGGITQGLIVAPNEFNLESPFIENNILYTLKAYGLDSVEERDFQVDYNLTSSEIEENRETIDNIRLWDWRPLIQTYNQLQLFRTYYKFWDVDIDRYEIDGIRKQVMVSARGLDFGELSPKADTWINRHMVYTHGYGLVMNPVDKVTEEGLPEFYVKDIPPQSESFEVDQPAIYFGEGLYEYALVKTTNEELDYPSGDQNVFTEYGGEGGVPLSDIFRRLVYAFHLGSLEILVSGALTPESRVLLNRDVLERADGIAPFLLYDSDPYVVLSGGKMYWIIDAYTTTDMYPYSEPIRVGNGMVFNYISNSVKVVMDAYDGDIDFYVIDEEDPVIKTYSSIFPDLFRDFSSMPDDLKEHIRYPEDLFRIQSLLYSEYHMKDPRVFYNKEDAWVIPDEIYRGSRQPMTPYYITIRLPGDTEGGFVLMSPFTPKGKENLIGWMAGKSDLEEYGELVVFRFSKQELTYGPMQIEARIDQDTEISQRITLWSQSGSDVIRGNTLIIPVENSIIYVEPLFLEATEKGTLPQLQRVIVSYGTQLSMQETLKKALDTIFGEAESGVPDTGQLPEGAEDILREISDNYAAAQDALKLGDLRSYAGYVDRIGELVKNWENRE